MPANAKEVKDVSSRFKDYLKANSSLLHPGSLHLYSPEQAFFWFLILFRTPTIIVGVVEKQSGFLCSLRDHLPENKAICS